MKKLNKLLKIYCSSGYEKRVRICAKILKILTKNPSLLIWVLAEDVIRNTRVDNQDKLKNVCGEYCAEFKCENGENFIISLGFETLSGCVRYGFGVSIVSLHSCGEIMKIFYGINRIELKKRSFVGPLGGGVILSSKLGHLVHEFYNKVSNQLLLVKKINELIGKVQILDDLARI